MNEPFDFQRETSVPLSPWSAQSLREFDYTPLQDAIRTSSEAIGLPGTYHPARVAPVQTLPDFDRDLRYLFEWSGDEFSNNDVLHPTGFFMYEGANTFHFQVWRAYEGSDSRRHGFVTSFPTVMPQLVFNEREDAAAFIGWLTGYMNFYGKHYDGSAELPVLPSHQRITAMPIFRTEFDTRDALIKDWAWIVRTFEGGVWFTQTHILFERDDEAEEYLAAHKRSW